MRSAQQLQRINLHLTAMLIASEGRRSNLTHSASLSNFNQDDQKINCHRSQKFLHVIQTWNQLNLV